MLRKYLEGRDLQQIFQVESAGVCVDDEPPRPPLALRRVARKKGYDFSAEPRMAQRSDLTKFGLVIAVDRKSLVAIKNFHSSPTSQFALLSQFLPAGYPKDVPDPMHRSQRTCNKVFDMLEQACPKIVDALWNLSP